MDRPVTTLFLIESLDGKISTGDIDLRDIDKDFKRIKGVKEGLYQYYDLETQTDPFSLNSGRVMAKIGVNDKTEEPSKIGCSFIIIDNMPHLTPKGVSYISKWVKKLFLVTTNPKHPAFELKDKLQNIEIIFFDNKVNLKELLFKLKTVYGVDRLTIQSGSTLNASWIRQSLIDYVSIVIAPCLIGGVHTPGLLGGKSLRTEEDLKLIKSLELVKNTTLKNSYIHLVYRVNNSIVVDVTA